jgi:hypothetical protein
MTPSDITGSWVHENAVPLGGGIMRVTSSWRFDADGTATFASNSSTEHSGQVVNQNSSNHVGRWSIASDKLVVELPDHSDSPFQLSMTEAGELKSRKRGMWRRVTAART